MSSHGRIFLAPMATAREIVAASVTAQQSFAELLWEYDRRVPVQVLDSSTCGHGIVGVGCSPKAKISCTHARTRRKPSCDLDCTELFLYCTAEVVVCVCDKRQLVHLTCQACAQIVRRITMYNRHDTQRGQGIWISPYGLEKFHIVSM